MASSDPRRGDERFPRARRLRSRSEFRGTYDGGRRLRGRFVVLFARPSDERGARLGVTVTRKIGCAAVRNRLRRRVREIFRRSPAARAIPSSWIVVNVSPLAVSASFSELRGEIEALFARIAGQAP